MTFSEGSDRTERPAHRRPRATRAARRQRELADGLARDLGHEPSTGERALIEQVAGLVVVREAMQQAVLRGELVNAAEITKISGAVTRCLNSLRPKVGRRTASSGPSILDAIIAERRGAR
ncbi:hypothetical protein JQ629_23525 [Bradyrhizobium sp. AUGA SZCCT0222]|uniref:hypothetical protein n=1 Tax=Bradyrhizobium sp. AUGA SZCCT0222 TaxID=2807668 RepID=UPI001BACA724|nr:hypothetical protein [Bradyrhizobium sp. AUGA SZCCT0222]MBR1270450.1 hypothetical protein [Bradyrhizobium sp. AUGA SZCCT0222]